MSRPPNLTAVPQSHTQPMTQTETGIFVACMMVKPQPEPVPAAELPQAVLALEVFKPEKFDSFFTGQVLLKRLTLTNALYDPGMVALAMVMPDRPGMAVLWAWTLYERGRELGRPYTISDFTDDFPMGPPTPDGAMAVWDQQKGDFPRSVLGPFATDNALDVAETWQEPAPADA